MSSFYGGAIFHKDEGVRKLAATFCSTRRSVESLSKNGADLFSG